MKKNVLNYLKVAACLPLAVIGAILKVIAVVFQVLSFLVHGDPEGAKMSADSLKRV